MGIFKKLFGKRKKECQTKDVEKRMTVKQFAESPKKETIKTMKFEDIHFYINSRRVGPTGIIGAQPDLTFFEQLEQYLEGDCTVIFQVGKQKVENIITLNKTEYKVENNFVPFDIESFVDHEKKRVRNEQERANFTDELTDVYFIPAQALLACKKTFPDFDRSQLVKDPKGLRFFVSHPWLTKEHPDPEGKHLALIQQHAKRQNQDTFYWIDYSCLPQQPRTTQEGELFKQTLPKISTIQSKGSTLVITEDDYSKRMWCYIEHFAGVLFSQRTHTGVLSEIEYIGTDSPHRPMVDKVQTLEEPLWDKLKVTNPSDVPGIKYNYIWLSNLAKFQLYDLFTELRRTIPGHEIYSGYHYPQCAFGIQHSTSVQKLRPLFLEFGGDMQYFSKEQSLIWLARRFSWSIFPDDYKVEEFKFAPFLFYSEDMVGWIALLLGIIKILNQGNTRIVNLRELYASIVLMSLFS